MKTYSTFSDLENKVILITGFTRHRKRDREAPCHSKISPCFKLQIQSGIDGEFEKELIDLGASDVDLLNFDLVDLDKAKEVINDFCKNKKPIEGLVNNAGISKDSLILRNKVEDTKNILDINLTAPML